METIAVLDRPDASTKALVAARTRDFTRVEQVDFGDLGLSRNHGAQAASGDFVAFLDGDDLWGAQWLALAGRAAVGDLPAKAIWHPEWLFMFSDVDLERRVRSPYARQDCRSYFLRHTSSTDPGFAAERLLLQNLWSANALAHREIFLETPYRQVRRDLGRGIEDWSWNLATISKGIPHLAVRNTVHMIRAKEVGSLNAQNLTEGLLPEIPDGLFDSVYEL